MARFRSSRYWVFALQALAVSSSYVLIRFTVPMQSIEAAALVLVVFHLAVFAAMARGWRPYSRIARLPLDLAVIGMGTSLGFAIFLTGAAARFTIVEVLPILALGLALFIHVGALVLRFRRLARLCTEC